ncbi:hypothetical protein PGR6_55660 [Pseudomonas sp. GR 6-02]|nr:hypothetical protein PGR6_55660 [Pseudomonas sp. GR 6-02]
MLVGLLGPIGRETGALPIPHKKRSLNAVSRERRRGIINRDAGYVMAF